jgi:hypothetical protein
MDGTPRAGTGAGTGAGADGSELCSGVPFNPNAGQEAVIAAMMHNMKMKQNAGATAAADVTVSAAGSDPTAPVSPGKVSLHHHKMGGVVVAGAENTLVDRLA